MTVAAKTLIVDLLSTIGEEAMPVRALIAAGELFGIRPENVRVALLRLIEAGTVERNERGLYRISAPAHAVRQHVVAWNRIEERVTAWRGGWVGVHTAGLSRKDRGRLRRRVRALRLVGMRELDGGLWLRPDNLKGGPEALRRELIGLGLDASAAVLAIAALDVETEARTRDLWDVDGLRRGYRDLCASLEHSAARLHQLPPRKAMVESFLLGGEGIRRIILDPLLPEPIVPSGERAALVETMRRYDRLGRETWRPFMREQGAPHLKSTARPSLC